MALNIKTYELQNIAIEPKLGLKDYSSLYKNGIRIKDILLNRNTTTDVKSGRTPSKFNEDYWNGEYDFLTMEDVDTFLFRVKENCESKITEYAIENEKTLYKAPKNSLIISNAMTIGLSFISEKEIYINQNVFHLALDENKVNKVFLLWYFNLGLRPIFQKLFASKYLSKDELSRIKIPKIPKPIQDQVVAKIDPIEQKIKQLKSQIKQPQEIINKVFAREFGFDENLYNDFGKGMTAGTQIAQNRKLRVFETDFQDFARSSIFRFSTRFHNPPTKELMDFMDNIKTLKVKDIINTYEKGIQPKYNTDGDIPVVKIANLKNGYIDFSETENITSEYFKKLDDKKKLKVNDVIICVTGKISLGKIDIFEEEREAITTVDNYIVRINENKYNPLFFTYFFRSILGFFQIERDYTGATNQIHLYWNQISEFDIPDISLKEQKRIVNEIKNELDNQNKIEKEIENERSKIDKIIEEVIK